MIITLLMAFHLRKLKTQEDSEITDTRHTMFLVLSKLPLCRWRGVGISTPGKGPELDPDDRGDCVLG